MEWGLGVGGCWAEGLYEACKEVHDIIGQQRKKPPPTLPRTGEDGVEITGGKGNEVVWMLKRRRSERFFSRCLLFSSPLFTQLLLMYTLNFIHPLSYENTPQSSLFLLPIYHFPL